MADVTLTYKGATIAELSDSGSKTLRTAGKYCEADIGVEYVKPSGGETTASQKDVNFIDFDGTIRYSYSASEFANLTALPANPSHSGLTSQGWNWSLADAKAYVAKYGKLWIGQMYVTDDGKTRVYIHLEEGRTSPMLGCCPNGTVVVDWGDGSATETLTGTSLTTAVWTSTHNYAAAGDYVITLEVTSGTVTLSGESPTNQHAYLLRYSTGTDGRNVGYQNAIQRVEIGENTSIGGYAFYYCYGLSSITIPDGVTIGNTAFQNCRSLSSITIPDGVTSIGDYEFFYCYGLSSITIPNGVTSIGSYAFEYCYGLVSITIPDGVTSIGDYEFFYCYGLSSITIPNGVTSIGSDAFQYCFSLSSITIPDGVTIGNTAFQNCRSLSSITIPDGVTSIENNTFQNCYSLAKLRFEPTTPPTVSNSNAWTNIPTDCVIYVPERTMEAYTSATNYPDPATYKYVSTITVDGDVFWAENGMTWQQWVDSDYNTIGAYIDGEGFVACHFDDGGAIDPCLRYFENTVGDNITAVSTDVINFSPKDEDGNDTNWTWV